MTLSEITLHTGDNNAPPKHHGLRNKNPSAR